MESLDGEESVRFTWICVPCQNPGKGTSFVRSAQILQIEFFPQKKTNCGNVDEILLRNTNTSKSTIRTDPIICCQANGEDF